MCIKTFISHLDISIEDAYNACRDVKEDLHNLLACDSFDDYELRAPRGLVTAFIHQYYYRGV